MVQQLARVKTPPAAARQRISSSIAPAQLAMAVVAASYATFALTWRQGVFWSSDQGGKLLQALALLERRYDLSISYPGQWLDPELVFRPYMNAYVVGGTIQMPWPMAWAAPSAVLYGAFGAVGLLTLPLVGGLLAAWGAGGLAERMRPGCDWLAILLTGLATPLFVYSTQFWEHAAVTGLLMAGLLLGPLSGSLASPARLLMAGICFGLMIAWRSETTLYLLSVAVAGMLTLPAARSWRGLAWLAGGIGLTMSPVWAYNWLFPATAASRAHDLSIAAPRSILANLVHHLLWLPADLLVGYREYGLLVPEPIRWAPAVGLVLLLGLWLLRGGAWGRSVRLAALALAGLPTAALFIGPAPRAIHGFVIAAPFLVYVLLSPSLLVASRTGRFLCILAAVVPLIYSLAALVTFAEGVSFGGYEWGPRYLLPLYPPLCALVAVVLDELVKRRQWSELALGVLLVALGLGFQLTGLLEIDRARRQSLQEAQLLTSLSDLPIVIRPSHLVQIAPELTRERSVFCAETPLALKRWTEAALNRGVQQFWFVDTGPLPRNWLSPAAVAPVSLAETKAPKLQATLYPTAAVHATLRTDGEERLKCGTNVAGPPASR